MSVDILLVTHSTTTDNEAGNATGWLPGELSATGRMQAAALGARYRDASIDLVICSDLHRAVETASIAFERSDITFRTDARLRECNYGALNGTPAASLARTEHIDTPFPGGESYGDVVARTRDFLSDLAANHDGARVLVIAHSANRYTLEHLLRGVPLDEAVAAVSEWQPGWLYSLPGGWAGWPDHASGGTA